MALYEYKCGKCGVMEIEQSVKDSVLSKCPKCNGRNFIKLISLSNFQLKGNGWYKTDYSSKKEPKEKK
jgi:putative FmdB family regulatory protein